MRARSGHIVLNEGYEYQDLSKVFEELFNTFIDESNQVIEDDEYKIMLIHLNVEYLERNQKPEGYNRPGKMRMLFPIRDDDRIEFFLVTHSASVEVARVTELLASVLSTHGIEHEIYWDDIPKKEDIL